MDSHGQESEVHNKITLPTPLYALIIGINAYPSDSGWDPLQGAVADADNVNDFFVNSLGVEQEHIINLRDEQATRAAILKGFDSIINNNNIRENDAIVIYYAGHGARDKKPESEEWNSWVPGEDQIEMICPVDIGASSSATNFEPIQGIPDRTIAAKLNELSRVKGNNIIVIFDCCHSAGANRSIPKKPTSLKPRCLLNPPRITAECDSDIWSSEGNRAMGTSIGFLGQNQESHIFLAACGRDQSALENQETKQGLFTTWLLEGLKEFGNGDLTYLALIQRVVHKFSKYPMKEGREQTPHYYGKYINRRLFSILDAPVDTTMFYGHTIRYRKKTEDYVPRIAFQLFAGHPQGIQKHAEFEIYKTNLLDDSTNQPLGRLKAEEVRVFKTTLAYVQDCFKVPGQFYAKEVPSSNVGMITVYCETPSFVESLLASGQPREHNIKYATLEDAGIQFVDDIKDAMVELIFNNGEAEFYTTDQRIIKHLGRRIPRYAKADDMQTIWKVLIALGRFNRFLDTSSNAFKKDVRMQLRRLKRERPSGFSWLNNLIPTGENIIELIEMEGMDGSVDVTVDTSEYGVTLENKTQGEEEVDLYPYLIYFDACSLSIQDWYMSPLRTFNGRLPDAPLPASSEFKIGYGNLDVVPWSFSLGEDVTKEMGFLKLYVAVQPIDIQPVKQMTPFDQNSGSGRSGRDVNPPSEFWGTQTFVVVQRKKESADK